MKKIRESLADGNKVKVTIWLKGRQKRKPEMLDVMVGRIMEVLREIAEIEAPPKRETFVCHIMIGAKKGGKDAKVKNA
jgi:translation initiation factor IF-3